MTRITNAMLTTNYLSDMQTNLSTMSSLQSQLSSGKTIQSAADDPATAGKIMKLNRELSANTQFSTNISDATNWLDTTDTALGEAGNVLSRIRQLMVKAGNGSYGTDEISSIKDEVVSDVQQLGQVLNTSFNGNYIFGGTKSSSKPVTVDSNGNMNLADANGNAITAATDPTSYNQIASDLNVEVSEGVKVTYNQNAAKLLQFNDSNLTPSNVDAMSVLKNIVSDLGTLSSSSSTTAQNNTALTDLNGSTLNQMDSVINNFLSARSKVGAMENRMQSVSTTNTDQNYNMTSILSNAQDVDITEKTVEYSSAQTVYKAALQVSSTVLQKTLMDYL
jgi:flagellar hook-associated protein 3 FlgL